MELILKIYIIGFIASYVVFTLVFIYYEGHLKDLLIVCFMSWFAFILYILSKTKRLLCRKYYNKFKYKYWFHRVDAFSVYPLKRNKENAIRNYLDEKIRLKNKNIHFNSKKAKEVKERFIRRYF